MLRRFTRTATTTSVAKTKNLQQNKDQNRELLQHKIIFGSSFGIGFIATQTWLMRDLLGDYLSWSEIAELSAITSPVGVIGGFSGTVLSGAIYSLYWFGHNHLNMATGGATLMFLARGGYLDKNHVRIYDDASTKFEPIKTPFDPPYQSDLKHSIKNYYLFDVQRYCMHHAGTHHFYKVWSIRPMTVAFYDSDGHVKYFSSKE